jgi:hypothetical protein
MARAETWCLVADQVRGAGCGGVATTCSTVATKVSRAGWLVVEGVSGRGQCDHAAGAVEQASSAELALQGPQCLAGSRRGEPELFGGAAEVQLLGQHEEQAEFAQLDVDHREVTLHDG